MYQEQQIQAPKIHDVVETHTGASAFDWAQLIFLPIFLSVIGLISLRIKVNASNRKRRKIAEERDELDEYSDDTIMDYLKKRK